MEFDAKKEAARLFNETWDMLDLTERTDEQKAEMLHKAHASRYFWGLVGTPLNVSTGEWQISRVYSLLGDGGLALLHGELCLKITKENDLPPFNLAFAYEAVARAHLTLGDNEKAVEYVDKALYESCDVNEKEDRDYVEGDLKSIKAAALKK